MSEVIIMLINEVETVPVKCLLFSPLYTQGCKNGEKLCFFQYLVCSSFVEDYSRRNHQCQGHDHNELSNAHIAALRFSREIVGLI